MAQSEHGPGACQCRVAGAGALHPGRAGPHRLGVLRERMDRCSERAAPVAGAVDPPCRTVTAENPVGHPPHNAGCCPAIICAQRVCPPVPALGRRATRKTFSATPAWRCKPVVWASLCGTREWCPRYERRKEAFAGQTENAVHSNSLSTSVQQYGTTLGVVGEKCPEPSNVLP
jgi:hypothetical protein